MDLRPEPYSEYADPAEVLQDFSDWLHEYADNISPFIELSENCLDMMERWGTEYTPFPDFQGSLNAHVFIVDSEGSFFEGESGRLLVKILKAMNLDPDHVFICSPCSAVSIEKAVEKVRPCIIITLGKKAADCILDSSLPLEKLRGKFHSYKGIRVMPSLHPSLLLKKPEFKRHVWNDMKLVMALPEFKHENS